MYASAQSTEDLSFVLQHAQPGDTIVTGAANFGEIVLTGFSFSPAVKVVFHQDATIERMTLNHSTGLHFENATINAGVSNRPQSERAIFISGGGDIQFDHATVSWSDDGNNANDGTGIIADGVRSLTIQSSEFHHALVGVQVRTSSDVTIQNNHFSNIVADGIVVSGTSKLNILENVCINWTRIDGANAHPDCIQLQSGFRAVANTHTRIAGNVMLKGVGERFQGIFVSSRHADSAHINTVIEDNIARLDVGLGIGASNVDGLIIRNNDIRASQKATEAPRIVVYDNANNVKVIDNVAARIRTPQGSIVSGNTLPQ